jgi:arginine-tRNA-protein transferase
MSFFDSDSSVRRDNAPCRLVVIQDELQSCPYRADTIARMPLQLPVGKVTPSFMDELLALGFRRSGNFFYRTQCPTCQECRPTRVEVNRFHLTTSMKRVLQRGERELECRWGPPQVDSQRVSLFNAHRAGQHLGTEAGVDSDSYRSFLVESCCRTQELSISFHSHLIAASVMDIGHHSTSAVYTYFDPAQRRYSLGTFAVLKQIQWAIENQRRYVYLGMYVAENSHLNYKARYLPQQRLIAGNWTDYEN